MKLLKILLCISFVILFYGCGYSKIIPLNEPNKIGRDISEIEKLSTRYQATIIADCPDEDCIFTNVQNIKFLSDSIKFRSRTKLVSRHLESDDNRYPGYIQETLLLSSIKSIKLNRRLKGAFMSLLIGSAFLVPSGFVAGASYNNSERWDYSRGRRVAKMTLLVTGPISFISGIAIGSEARYENLLYYSEQSEEERIRRRFSPRN